MRKGRVPGKCCIKIVMCIFSWNFVDMCGIWCHYGWLGCIFWLWTNSYEILNFLDYVIFQTFWFWNNLPTVLIFLGYVTFHNCSFRVQLKKFSKMRLIHLSTHDFPTWSFSFLQHNYNLLHILLISCIATVIFFLGNLFIMSRVCIKAQL